MRFQGPAIGGDPDGRLATSINASTMMDPALVERLDAAYLTATTVVVDGGTMQQGPEP